MYMYNTFEEIRNEARKTEYYFDISRMTLGEARTKATREIKTYASFCNKDTEYLKAAYYSYKNTLAGMEFHGKMFIVRPYASLFEAVMDGIVAHNAAGMEAAFQTAESDEVVLCVRHASAPDKTFGYVKYDRDGTLITCRSLCNIEVDNFHVRQFFVRYGKEIIAKGKEKQTIETKAM